MPKQKAFIAVLPLKPVKEETVRITTETGSTFSVSVNGKPLLLIYDDASGIFHLDEAKGAGLKIEVVK